MILLINCFYRLFSYHFDEHEFVFFEENLKATVSFQSVKRKRGKGKLFDKRQGRGDERG